MKKVHVIPHSHWDREWYFSTTRSTIYLIKHLKEVIEELEKNNEFKSFLMDAQSSLISDYLKFCPEDIDRIKELVKNKRLFIGPWWSQTDQMVISQESILRNLLYGTRYAQNLGGYFNIAYAPDIFGHSGNMPQIYKEFGLNKFLFWRGVSNNTLSNTEFVWEGYDGTRMIAKQIREGYYNCGNLAEKEENILEFLNLKMSDLESKTITDTLYFANGFDQAPIRKNLPEIIKKYNDVDKDREYKISTVPEYFDDLEKDLKNKKLKILKGELTEAKHSRIHKSIYSNRADLKQMNNKNENMLINVLEPLMCLCHHLGNRYPKKEIDKIWKMLFENSAHDSIGQCNSDTTNDDIYYRHKIINDYIINLLDINLRQISSKILTDKEFHFVAFNPYPEIRNVTFEFNAYIPHDKFKLKDFNGNELKYIILEMEDQTEYVLNQYIKLDPYKEYKLPDKVYYARVLVNLKEIEALGYKSFYIDLDEPKEELNKYKLTNENFIENKKYRIKFNSSNNSIDIFDKENNKEYKNQLIFEENGDDGDSYNYSPPRKDKIIKSSEAKLISKTVEKSIISEKMTVNLLYLLPYDLVERSENKCTREYKMSYTVELREDDSIIRISTEFNNVVLSHRFCVLFDTGISSHFSIADQVFGVIKRPVFLETMKVWEKEKWQEIPNCIEPMQSYVAHNGISIITENVKEYEIIGDNYETIRLTLFRTYSNMGKEDLLYRPGRASGETIVKTPNAQLIKKLKFDFAIYTYDDFEKVNIGKTSKLYLSPIITYQQSEFLNGRMIFCYREEEKSLKHNYSFKEFVSEAVVGAIKKAEDSDNYIIRYFNPYFNKQVELPKNLNNRVSINELDEKEDIKEIGYCEIATYKF